MIYKKIEEDIDKEGFLMMGTALGFAGIMGSFAWILMTWIAWSEFVNPEKDIQNGLTYLLISISLFLITLILRLKKIKSK